MKRTFLKIILLTAIASGLNAQSTFMIGTSHGYYSTTDPLNYAADIITTSTYNGGYSSANNVLVQDGFNYTNVTWPDPWTTKANYSNLISLLKKPDINMKLSDATGYFFKPATASPCTTGTNQYNAQSSNPAVFVGYDYDWLYQYIYNDPVFYTHSLGTEFYAFHYYPVANYANNWCDVSWYGCSTHAYDLTCENGNFRSAEPPPQNVSDAINYYKSTYSSITTPINLGVATHNGFLNDSHVDACYKSAPYNGRYNMQNYVDYNTIPSGIPGVTNPHKADLIFEDSYYNSAFADWAINNNYLGKFINIDYLHSKGYTRIFSENDIAAEWNSELHSNPNILNANMLRFLTYTAIIHGVEGIGFYSLSSANAYNPYTNTVDVNFDPPSDNGMDKTRYQNINNPASSSRFSRANFPYTYQAYVSNLTRELRYLANNNFVIPNNSSGVLYKKLGDNVADPNNIVESCLNYMPATISAADAADYNLIKGFFPTHNVVNVQRREDHGIRYIITTNANGEAVMIASNPNPYSVHGVDFNFGSVTNTAISNAIAVDVLFDDGSVTNVNAANYKTDTASTVQAGTFALLKKHSIPFCSGNKKITADFGPFDVKIFNFKKSLSTAPDYANGWQNTWSNMGNNEIGSWGGWTNSIKTDKFIAIDFNKDNVDELLCVQDVDSDGPSFPAQDAWASVLTFNGTTWSTTPMWTNLGNGCFNKLLYTGWSIKAGDKYIAGDFDGDGFKNELLCIQGKTGSYASLLRANTTTMNFDIIWSNNGSKTISGWGMFADDKFINGDFDSDGKSNDLLCFQGVPNGWWATLKFTMSPLGFNWLIGSASPISNWNIGSADQFISGDFDGDGKANEVMCLDGANTNTAVLKMTGGTWVTEWKDVTGAINGWGRKNGDRIIAGDLDTDSKDEIMCIQYSGISGWATTLDQNSSNNGMVWNWSNHNYGGLQQNYIGNWAVRDAYALDVKYMFLKPVAGQKKQLLAFKDYGCGKYLINMYKPNSSGNYKMSNQMQEGLNVSKESYFKLFPNPSKGSFTIAVENEDEKTILITDILGRKIYEKKVNEQECIINLEGHSKGVYFVTLSNENKVETKKVIID